MTGGDLVAGDARENIGRSLAHVDASEIGAAAAAMIAGAVQPRPPGVVRQVAQEEGVIFERLERLQDPRQFTELPFIVRIPMLHHYAVWHVHEHHSHRRLARRLARRQRRCHRVEERERNRSPHPFEDRSSWNRFSCNHYWITSSYVVTNLFVTVGLLTPVSLTPHLAAIGTAGSSSPRK